MTTMRILGAWSALLIMLAPWTVTARADSGSGVCTERDCPVTVFAVGHVNARPGATVRVPVRVSDVTGTPLGNEKSMQARIDALSFRVRFVPAEAIVAARVLRAGLTEHAVPRFEAAPRTADGVSYLAVFDGQTSPLALAPQARRQTIALLELTLAAGVHPATRIELRLDPASTVLSNAAGTVSESVANGFVRVVDGSIMVD